MSKNNSTEDALRSELEGYGAREFEIIALTMEPNRGLAALRYATSKGAEHPIAYAIKVFDNPDWQPSGEKPRHEVNRAVTVECTECGGDRFVLAYTRKPQESAWMQERGMTNSATELFEVMKPCPACNS